MFIALAQRGFYQSIRRGVLLAVAALCWATNVAADPLASSEAKSADVRVVIDVSGSMKQNDPNNLRRPALELLVKLLPDNSKAGVWAFGKYVNMLVPHREVNADWRSSALAQAENINSAGLFTNIGEALDKAAYDRHQPRGEFRTSIILLTDGMVDISREPADNQAEWRRIVDELLPELKAKGYTIHTIALSDIADRALMDKLALSTDGLSAVAKTADDLMKIFLQAFDAAIPAERLPLDDNSFVVDSSVEEFTALIFRKPGSPALEMIAPDGEVYRFEEENAFVNWYRAEKYDLITVTKPIEGEWLARAELEPDSRVTVVSNLNLAVKPIKHNLFRGDETELSLSFRESGKLVQDPQFLGLLDISYLLVHRDSGRRWEGVVSGEKLSGGELPSDGIFAAPLDQFTEEGYYDLSVLVDGKSFKREFAHSVAVREAFALSIEKDVASPTPRHLLKVQSFGDNIDYARSNVVARIKDPRGVSSLQTLSLTENDDWAYTFVPEIEGSYDIQLRIAAVDRDGGKFEFDPAPVQIHFPDNHDPFQQQLPKEEAPLAALEPQEQVLAQPEAEPEQFENNSPEENSPEENAPEENAAEASSSNLWLYLGLAAGNILVLALAFVAYRTIMASRKDPELDELEQAVEEVKAAKPAAGKLSGGNAGKENLEQKPAKEKALPPSMADMDVPLDDEDALSEGFDGHELSSETQLQEDDDALAAEPAALEPTDDEGDLGVADLQFSLDDFTDDDDKV